MVGRDRTAQRQLGTSKIFVCGRWILGLGLVAERVSVSDETPIANDDVKTSVSTDTTYYKEKPKRMQISAS